MRSELSLSKCFISHSSRLLWLLQTVLCLHFKHSLAECSQLGPRVGQRWLGGRTWSGPWAALAHGVLASLSPRPHPLAPLSLQKEAGQQGSLKDSGIVCSKGFRCSIISPTPSPADALSKGWTGLWRAFLSPQLSVGGCVCIILVWLTDRGAGPSRGGPLGGG